jgi:hypothetical protein
MGTPSPTRYGDAKLLGGVRWLITGGQVGWVGRLPSRVQSPLVSLSDAPRAAASALASRTAW